LALLYIGEAKVASHAALDRVHELCSMLCVAFPSETMSLVDAKKVDKDNDGSDDNDSSDDEVRIFLSKK
jgi:hypothetical protein